MGIRITQQYMYQNMVTGMQGSLGRYMNAMEAGSSQKAVNRPSDDPAAMYRILMSRNDINDTKQYLTNIDTAKGWLKMTDDVLSSQLTTTIRSLIALAEQASTGTYNRDQREQMSFEARELFGQVLNLSNTEHNGSSLFAGHKYDKNAYEQGLALTRPQKQGAWTDGEWDAWNDAIANGEISVHGASKTSIAIQFAADGTVGIDALDFVWSSDGGRTWKDGTLAAGATTLDIAEIGVQVDLRNGLAVHAPANMDRHETDDAMFFLNPAAFYQGDAGDPPPTVLTGGNADAGVTAEAAGVFGGNVLVRVDGVPNGGGGHNPVNLGTVGDVFDYAYSTDNGATWIPAKASTTGTDPIRLPVPGGYITLDATGAGTPGELAVGSEFLIHPDRANLGYEIMQGTYIDVNNVGKDIFGGYYYRDTDGSPVPAHYDVFGKMVPDMDEESNLFKVVGEFVTALEFNSQEGCQQALARLNKSLARVTTQAARTGGLENRVSLAYDVQTANRLAQEEVLSNIEDIDLTELLTKLTQYQATYQTVLLSTSKIMNLSLANYV